MKNGLNSGLDRIIEKGSKKVVRKVYRNDLICVITTISKKWSLMPKQIATWYLIVECLKAVNDKKTIENIKVTIWKIEGFKRSSLQA